MVDPQDHWRETGPQDGLAAIPADAAIILVNYNSGADLIECLEALLRLEGDSWRIIVVDNGSTDGSIEALEAWASAPCVPAEGSADIWQLLPAIRRASPRIAYVARGSKEPLKHEPGQIVVINAGENRGFAAGNNIGLQYAFEALACPYAWLLNVDTVPLPGAGAALLRSISADSSIGMLGSTLIYYHRPDQIQGVGVTYHLGMATGRQIFNGSRPDRISADSSIDVRISYVIGASMMISRSFFRDIGPMNESYFLYFEELDWALRARGKYRCSWQPASVVYHKEGGSIGTSSTSWPSATSVFYMSRGILLFYSRHAPALLPVAAARLAFNLLRMVAAGQGRLCAALINGVRAAVGRPGDVRP